MTSVDSANCSHCSFFPTVRPVSLVRRANQLDTSDLTCPPALGLLIYLFQSAPSKTLSLLLRPQLWPYPGSFSFEISFSSFHPRSHFHFPRPDLHPPSLRNYRNHLWFPPAPSSPPQSPLQRTAVFSLHKHCLPHALPLLRNLSTLPTSNPKAFLVSHPSNLT